MSVLQQQPVLIKQPVTSTLTQTQQQTMIQSNYKLLNMPQINPTAPVRPMMMISSQQTMPSIPQSMEITMEDQPLSKRLKTEETLISETDYLAQHASKGPVSFNVQIPNVPEKPEWNLNGQLIPFSMPLTETV